MKKLLLTLCSLVGLTTVIQSKAENFIFDLGYTTFEHKGFKAGTILGLGNCLYYLRNHSKEDLQNIVFEVLNFLGKQEGAEHTLVRINTGAPAPAIMVEWFKGTLASHIIFEQLDTLIENLYETDYFANDCEYALVKNTFTLMFDPHTLATVMKPIKKMQRLIKKLAQVRDKQGNLRHQFFILSNWDAESFDMLYNKYPEFFAYFDRENIIISGEIGLVKPHTSIFEYVLTTYQLNTAECIFIDDQKENIEAARCCHMQAFHYHKKHHKHLVKTLQEHNLL